MVINIFLGKIAAVHHTHPFVYKIFNDKHCPFSVKLLVCFLVKIINLFPLWNAIQVFP